MAKAISKTKKKPSVSNAKSGANELSPISSSISEGNDSGLEELFLDSIKDIYWAENHLVKAIPKMLKAAGTQPLKQAFANHLEVTKEHVARLEQIFELLGEEKQAKKCDAMEGLSIEGEGIIEDTEEGTAAREIGLIMAAQKVEHYEIATYGGLAKLAKNLGKDEISAILEQTLNEEQEADALLTTIAENDANFAPNSSANS